MKEVENIFILNGQRMISKETAELPFLKLNEGDNIYTICSFGICGDYPTAYIMNDNTVYRLPKEYMEVCEFFLLMPQYTFPVKVNFTKEGEKYNIKFTED